MAPDSDSSGEFPLPDGRSPEGRALAPGSDATPVAGRLGGSFRVARYPIAIGLVDFPDTRRTTAIEDARKITARVSVSAAPGAASGRVLSTEKTYWVRCGAQNQERTSAYDCRNQNGLRAT